MSWCSIGTGRVNMNRLRFSRQLKCRICGNLLSSVQITRVCILLIFLEFNCCHLCIGNFRTLLVAFFCLLPITSDYDHSSGTGNLQLEVHITWPSHKTCISRPTQDSMISTLAIYYLKCQLFLTVILGVTEDHVKVIRLSL